MKASKLVVLVGGILGILAFFLPLVTVARTNVHGTVSAFQLMKGLDTASGEVDKAEVQAASMEDRAAVQTAKDGLGALKGIVMAIFAPAILLALIGGLGVVRRKFGRVAGTFSLLLGLIGLGIAALLKSAAEGDAGIGMTFLLLTGVAGVVGGIMALAKPERALVAATATR